MKLPGVLAEIAEVAGEAAAIQICTRVGGTRVYIPAWCPDDHWLVDCVGRDKADRICAHLTGGERSGQRFDIPLANNGAYKTLRRTLAKRILDLDGERRSSREIARDVGVSQRTVHRHRTAHRGGGNSDQGSLF